MSIKKIAWKKFFIKLFLPKSRFQLLPNLSKNFFQEYVFLGRGKYTLKNVFLFLTLLLCNPTDNNVSQNIFFERTLYEKKSILKYIFDFHHLSCVSPMLIHTKLIKIFLSGMFFCEKSSPKYNFPFLSSVLRTPTCNYVIEKKFGETLFLQKTVFIMLFFVYNINSV